MIMVYAQRHELHIDQEMIEMGSQDSALSEREQFDEFLHSLGDEDMVIVDEMVTLGRDKDEVLQIINCMFSRGVVLLLASVDLRVDAQTPISTLLPIVLDIDKTKAEETVRHHQKGRPRGRRSASKFDRHLDNIITLLGQGMNVSAIARELRVSRSSLKDYIDSRQIKKILDDGWIEQLYAEYSLMKKDAPKMVCTLVGTSNRVI